MLPSLAPAPTMVCISSINRMIFPALFTSFMTAFSLSSNSPRYFAPAISALISSATTRLFARLVGTSFATIFCARPSTIAVLPTPGSPNKIGLFLLFLIKICIIRVISSSRPMTGSSSLFSAFAVRSMPYFSKLSNVSSLVWLSILRPALMFSKFFLISKTSVNLPKICLISGSSSAEIIHVSTAI